MIRILKTHKSGTLGKKNIHLWGALAMGAVLGCVGFSSADASILGKCVREAKDKAGSEVATYVKRYCLFTSKDRVPSTDAETIFSAYHGEDLKAKALRVREFLHRHYKTQMDTARAQGKDLEGQCEAVAKFVSEGAPSSLSSEKQDLFHREQGLRAQRYTERLRNLKERKWSVEQTKKSLPSDSTQHPALQEELRDIQGRIDSAYTHLKELGIDASDQGLLTPRHPRDWESIKDPAYRHWVRDWTHYCRRNPISAGVAPRP